MALPSDRATAASQSNPQAVSSIAGIPSAVELFPFTIECDYRGWSAHAFRDAFLARKPEGLTWYAYDVVVRSPNDVEFIVYSIACNVRGGVGREVARFQAEVPRSTTWPSIERQAEQLAKVLRRKELTEAEDEIIRGYASAIIAAQGTPTRSAETERLGPKDGGPVTEGDAPGDTL